MEAYGGFRRIEEDMSNAGTVVELDSDGLGWIQLDDGARVRFGFSACKGFTAETLVAGARVLVHGTQPGLRGVVKATAVSPLQPPPTAGAAAPARPEWLVVPLPHSTDPGAPVLARLAQQWQPFGIAAKPAGARVLELTRGDLSFFVEHVEHPYPTQEAPAHLVFSGGPLVDPTLLDTMSDAEVLRIERISRSGEGHFPDEIQAAALAARRVRLLLLLTGLATHLLETGLADRLVLPHVWAREVALSKIRTLEATAGEEARRDPGRAVSFLGEIFTDRLTTPDGLHATLLGAVVLGHPDIGVSLAASAEHASAAAALLQAMVPRGLRPRSGMTFEAEGTTFVVERLQNGAVWLQPAGPEAPHADGRYRFGVTACLPGYLQANWSSSLTWKGAGAKDPRIELWTTRASPSLHVAITNGLGARAQVGLGPADPGAFVEIAIVSPGMGGRVLDALIALAGSVHVPGRPAPLRAWDRCAVPGLPGGIAGAVLRPLGVMPVFPDHPVTVFDALPILDGELAAFRAAPSAQGAWIDRVCESNDFTSLHARWERLV